MAAKITNPGTQTFDGARGDHQSFRLQPQILAVIEDIAKGVEAGESGLKSCTVGGMQAGANGSEDQMAMVHAHEVPVLDEIDAYLDAVDQMLYDGFSHEEIAQTVKLWDGDVHAFAIERWADRVRLTYKTKNAPARWRASKVHEDRRRGERAMLALRQTPEGVGYAAVLHIVYGHPDPMLLSAKRFMRDCERAPAGKAPQLSPADRETFNLAKTLLEEFGDELAPLARYTDAVEARRIEMAHAEARRGVRATPYVPAAERVTDLHPHEEQLIGLSAAIAHMGEAMEAHRLAAKHEPKGSKRELVPSPTGPRPTMSHARAVELFDLERQRSVFHHAVHALSSGDALRAGVASFNEPAHPQQPGESYSAFEERRLAREDRKRQHRATADKFLHDVRMQADRMLVAASEAFLQAWKDAWRS